MSRPNFHPPLVLLAAAALATPAVAQTGPVFATPLPPGPGTVPLIPNSRLVAPVLMPLGAPTAQPVGIYQSPTAAVAPPSPPADCLADAGYQPATPTPRAAGRFWLAADFFYAAGQGVV